MFVRGLPLWGFFREQDSETLLKTDNKLLALELLRDGKFAVKSTGWDQHKVLEPGWYLRAEVVHGQWVISKRYDAVLAAEVKRPRVAYSPAAGGLGSAIANATASQGG